MKNCKLKNNLFFWGTKVESVSKPIFRVDTEVYPYILSYAYKTFILYIVWARNALFLLLWFWDNLNIRSLQSAKSDNLRKSAILTINIVNQDGRPMFDIMDMFRCDNF